MSLVGNNFHCVAEFMGRETLPATQTVQLFSDTFEEACYIITCHCAQACQQFVPMGREMFLTMKLRHLIATVTESDKQSTIFKELQNLIISRIFPNRHISP
jgi:hypothetical protein